MRVLSSLDLCCKPTWRGLPPRASLRAAPPWLPLAPHCDFCCTIPSYDPVGCSCLHDGTGAFPMTHHIRYGGPNSVSHLRRLGLPTWLGPFHPHRPGGNLFQPQLCSHSCLRERSECDSPPNPVCCVCNPAPDHTPLLSTWACALLRPKRNRIHPRIDKVCSYRAPQRGPSPWHPCLGNQ